MAGTPAGSGATLVGRLQGRDPGAFADLYRAHEDRIFRFAYRLAGNSHDAADLVQETFVRVLARIDRIDTGRDLGPYLMETAKNVFLTDVKRRRRQEPVEDVPEPDELAPIDEDPERAALLRRQQEEVRLANARLVPRQRLVLALRELEDRSYAEIGEVVGLNENAVAQAIFRARQSLRDELRLQQVDTARLPEACRAMLPLLSAHLDGQLKGEKLERTLAHLDACAHCHAALEDMREAQRRYRVLIPPVFLLAGLGERVEHAVAEAGYREGARAGEGAHGSVRARARRRIARRAGLSTPAIVAVIVALVVGAGALAAGGIYLATRGGDGESPATATSTTGPTGGPSRRQSIVAPPSTQGSGRGWERVSRTGLSNLTQPAVAADGDKAIVAWTHNPLPSSATAEAATFTSAPGDAVGDLRVTPVVRGYRSVRDGSLLRAPGGGLRLLFGALHSTRTGDPLNGSLIAERRPDGTWAQPILASGGRLVSSTDAAALPDGTPVWGGFDVTVYIWRGIDPDQEAVKLGSGFLPAFGVDGTGALWVAWYHEAILMRRLDPATARPTGPVHRAPAVDGGDVLFNHVALACNPTGAGCRVVYRGAARFAGKLLSWAPGERRPTVVASPVSLRDFDAAYRSDRRLWVAWYDRGDAADREPAPGYHATLGDERGAGGRVVEASQPARELSADWQLAAQPLGQGLVLVANLEVQPGRAAVWAAHVAAP